jgi:hypothetical protein
VGIRAGLALAAALPELPYACGLNTVALLTDDVAEPPLLATRGELAIADRGRSGATAVTVRAPAQIAESWRIRFAQTEALLTEVAHAYNRDRARQAIAAALRDHVGPRSGAGAGFSEFPLAYASSEAEQAGLLRMRPVDERTAGFRSWTGQSLRCARRRDHNLGYGRGEPASGRSRGLARASALIMITADRPRAPHDQHRANQTTHQISCLPGTFGPRRSWPMRRVICCPAGTRSRDSSPPPAGCAAGCPARCT